MCRRCCRAALGDGDGEQTDIAILWQSQLLCTAARHIKRIRKDIGVGVGIVEAVGSMVMRGIPGHRSRFDIALSQTDEIVRVLWRRPLGFAPLYVCWGPDWMLR